MAGKLKTTRKNTYKILLDTLPRGSLLIVLYFLIVGTIIGTSVVYCAPFSDKFTIKKPTLNYQKPFESLDGSQDVLAELKEELSFFNQELSLSIYLKKSNLVQSITKSDVKIGIGQGKEQTNHTRSLTCNKDKYYCEPIILFRERYIEKPTQKRSVYFRFQNLQPLITYEFLEPGFEIRFEYTNENYTQFSTIFKMTFMMTSLIVLVLYFIYVMLKQQWKFWKTEQKWVLILLVSLVFFNNPAYMFDYITTNWLMPTINILFTSTFIAVFILFVMVISHSIIVKPKERTFFFYMPKFLMVGILWISIVGLFMYERFNQTTDGAFEIGEVQFWKQIMAILSVLIAICVGTIFYYVIRAWGDQNISNEYSTKFKYFSLLTLLVTLATSFDYATFFLFNELNPAQWLSFYPIFNFYSFILAILFLPSNGD
eukprot:gene12816-7168_t